MATRHFVHVAATLRIVAGASHFWRILREDLAGEVDLMVTPVPREPTRWIRRGSSFAGEFTSVRRGALTGSARNPAPTRASRRRLGGGRWS